MALSISKTYMIKSYNGNGACLDLYNGSNQVQYGKNVQLRDEDNSSMGQRWRIKNSSGAKNRIGNKQSIRLEL